MNKKGYLVVLFFVLLAVSFYVVLSTSSAVDKPKQGTTTEHKKNTPEQNTMNVVATLQPGDSAGLINICEADSTIVIRLKYASADNFVGVPLYDSLAGCFLHPDAAKKLVAAQQLLKSRYPYYSLLVFDATRPLSIQQKMWDAVNLPVAEKTKFLSNPRNGSLHNYGAAVDISIINENGVELDMGTPYDFMGELAYPKEEDELITEGKLSFRQFQNRKLLREVMEASGFTGIATEWWHFNACTREYAKMHYRLIP